MESQEKKVVYKSKLKSEGWKVDNDGNRKNKFWNIVKIFQTDVIFKDLFAYNEFSGNVELTRDSAFFNKRKGGHLNDIDDILTMGYISGTEEYFFEPSVESISKAVIYCAKQKSFHPIKDYLEGIVWDKKERLDTWLIKAVGTEDNIYTRDVGRKLLCSAVARIYEPGIKFDFIVVLEGKQGIMKSTLVKVLGGKWYAELNNIEKDAEAVNMMLGKWILESAELLAVKRASSADHLNAFLSRDTDRVRLPYGRRAEDFPRQSIIIGTHNPVGDNQYLKGEENRRFWAIRCSNNIDLSWVKENRDQLFAEVLVRYKDEPLYFDNQESIKISLSMQSERRVSDSWRELIEAWLINRDATTPNEILLQCLSFTKDKINHSNLCRVGACIKDLGWEIKRYGVSQKKYYCRKNKLTIPKEFLENEDIQPTELMVEGGESNEPNNEQGLLYPEEEG